jgi:hypothetical protein
MKMSSNPADCRRLAELCLQRASEAHREIDKVSLIGVARNWEKLANELENVQRTQDQLLAGDNSSTPLFR